MSERVIKFRGMILIGKWVYGNLSILTKNVDRVRAGTYISNSVGLPFAYEVRPETVGQFIGLLDKNGKEIYEGDIIKTNKSEWSHYEDSDIYFDNHYGSFRLRTDEDEDGIEMNTVVYSDIMEIIGNVHEDTQEAK